MATDITNHLGSIQGYVIDVGAGGATTRRRPRQTRDAEQTHNPVANAQISIHESGYKTGTEPFRTVLTDVNGHYFIDLPVGTYDLVCEAFSPTAQEKRGIKVTEGEVSNVP
jgi:Carboxypeptidase regulatory-like domain